MTPSRGPRGYLELSKRPLHVLLFVLPLILLYEVGSAIHLANHANGTIETIRAHSILLGFFQDFGVVGRFLPGVALIVVLLAWHILNDDRWYIRPRIIAGIAVESAVWTIPLVVLIALVQFAGGGGAVGAAGGGGGGGEAIQPMLSGPASMAAMSWQARLTISIGAGIYEELLFRMIGIAALHLVLVDLVRLRDRAGTTLAVVISAVAFAVYHDITTPTGHLDILKGLVLVGAGIYFGVLYLTRGFAVVVGVHALYDIFVLVILPPG